MKRHSHASVWLFIGIVLALGLAVYFISPQQPSSNQNEYAQAATATVTLDLSRFLGGNQDDRAQGCFVDASGNIYVAGHTRSSTLPNLIKTFGCPNLSGTGNTGGCTGGKTNVLDAFVTKFNSSGATQWSIILGGNWGERGYGVFVDDVGDIYLNGVTESPNFPTTANAYQQTITGTAISLQNFDIWFSKIRTNGTGAGTSMLYSSYFGSDGKDWTRASMDVTTVAQNGIPKGVIYIAGVAANYGTGTNQFPTKAGALSTTHKGPSGTAPLSLGGVNYIQGDESEGVVFAVDPAQSGSASLLYSTFLGGSTAQGGMGYEQVYSNVKIYPDGSILVGGYTNSKDFPTTTNGFQRTYGGDLGTSIYSGDGFLARLEPNLSALRYSTYYGGSGNDSISGNDSFETDASGNVYATALTSGGVTLPGGGYVPYQSTSAGGNDGVIVKFNPTLSTLNAATYMGGSGFDELGGVVVDSQGYVYVSGNTSSSNYPTTPGAYDTQYNGTDSDVIFSIFTNDLTQLVYSTFLGGNDPPTSGDFGDRARCAVLNNGKVVLAGDTASGGSGVNPPFPTTMGPAFAGAPTDAFVSRFAVSIFSGPVCGDGQVGAGEVCDPPNSTQTCTTTQGYSGNQACNGTCTAWGTCSSSQFCGDGSVNGNEVCDGGTQACTTAQGYAGNRTCLGTCNGYGGCVATQFCGDGQVNGPEQCEGASQQTCVSSGNTGTQTCNAGACTWGSCICTASCGAWGACVSGTQSRTCVASDCTSFTQNQSCGGSGGVCGNGILETGEACENGQTQTCTTAQGYAGSQVCVTNMCAWGTCTSSQSCGDGTINGPELCDGGTQACTTAQGYSGSQACASNCFGYDTCTSTQNCGDGICNGNETIATCAGDCTIPPVCGNNVVENGEACDDGNTTGEDGCSSTCRLEYCGDARVQEGLGETCDDGNTQSCDGCSSVCVIEISSCDTGGGTGGDNGTSGGSGGGGGGSGGGGGGSGGGGGGGGSGSNTPFCGNKICSPGESSTCPQDCGGSAACVPTLELCDGTDNDCDAEIDEGCAITTPNHCSNDVYDREMGEEQVDCGGTCPALCPVTLPPTMISVLATAASPLALLILFILRLLQIGA